MARDQFASQDPTTQHEKTVSDGEETPYPGRTDQLDNRPDHGEHTYRGAGRLTGKKTVITGGDSGIGRAVAVAFAREGADVLLSYLESEEQDAQETARLAKESGQTAVLVPGDIRDEAHCQRIIETAADEFGQIDVLVNNAAYQRSSADGIAGITTERFDRVFKTNVYALFWLCKAAVPHMPAGSSIINSSSIQAFQPSAHLLDYAASKGAIVDFTKGLASDLIGKGIRVNSVAPGPVWTPLIPATMPADKVDSFGKQSPMGRPAQPAELAPAYVFFASQESSYITAETLGVTGGSPIT
jgi:NAD(P)-dependent dehydrogenase (short-subunit alcohol dehydrogenase family)